METRRLEELAQRLVAALPPGLAPARAELHDNLRAVLQSQLPRLGLVGREEFEAARATLGQTRARVEALEVQVEQLERQLGGDSTTG